MRRSRLYSLFTEFARVSKWKTIWFNFISKHVERSDGGLILIYKNTTISFEEGSKLIVNGGLCFLGSGSPVGSRNTTLIRLEQNSIMSLQANCTINYGTDILLKRDSEFKMGYDSYLNCRCVVRCHYRIELGSGCITGTEVDLRDIYDHTINGVQKKCATIIGNHVWMGARVMVLGAKISDGCVIGACALVTKDIPPKCIAYGVPAVVHKKDIEWGY